MLKINNVIFYKSFNDNNNLPATNLPEIAFVGRSNVGKSSLLNDLCKKKIAKISATPGKTQLLNYFLINNTFYFVDLPGYGFAKVSQNIKKKWENNIETYLQTRKQLKLILFLLDIRRIPNENDKMLNMWFKNLKDITTLYILTKSDKLSKAQREKQRTMIALELFVDRNDFLFYSVPKNTGRLELLKQIENIGI